LAGHGLADVKVASAVSYRAATRCISRLTLAKNRWVKNTAATASTRYSAMRQGRFMKNASRS